MRNMNRRMIALSLMTCTCLLTAAAVYAAQGLAMKCQAEPEKNPATGKAERPCGYESEVTFGGGMMFEQITGYCRHCKKFVYLQWTRENLPAGVDIKAVRRPEPLGEVWDSATGKIMTVYACPTCKGPFLPIKNADELKCCPVCNKPHFAVDKSKPEMAID
jgi:hypothetical protein